MRGRSEPRDLPKACPSVLECAPHLTIALLCSQVVGSSWRVSAYRMETNQAGFARDLLPTFACTACSGPVRIYGPLQPSVCAAGCRFTRSADGTHGELEDCGRVRQQHIALRRRAPLAIRSFHASQVVAARGERRACRFRSRGGLEH